MQIIFSPSAPIMRGWRPEEDFSLGLSEPTTNTLTGEIITPTIKDLTYYARSASGVITKRNIIVTTAPDAPVEMTSDTPAVCTVSQDGTVQHVTTGSCIVNARGRTGNRKITQTIATSVASIYYSVTARAAGSMRKYLYDQQIAALSGVTPGSAAQRAHATPYDGGFSLTGSNVNTGNFIRAQGKAGFDALPLDALDELLVGAGGSAQWRAWISPHHFLTWRGHGSSSSAGQWVSDGEMVVEYSATAWTGTLCKLLPANWRSYMPDTAFGNTSIYDVAFWTRHYNTYDVGADKRWVMPAIIPLSVSDTQFTYQKRSSDGVMSTGGDSGSPAFLGVNGSLVVIGHTASYGATASVSYMDKLTEINSAMATLNASGPYTAQSVDLTGFTTYP